jgi:hypothetical protein
VSSQPEEKFPKVQLTVCVGFHGTDYAAAKSILEEGRFRTFCKPTAYLGFGVYFYQNCRECAWKWARGEGKNPPVVFQCTIALGKCLDFTDRYVIKRVSELYRALKERLLSKPLTQHLVRDLTEPYLVNKVASDYKVDTVRAVYNKHSPLVPGGRIYVGKIPLDRPKVICVRKKEMISNLALELQQTTQTEP